METELAVWDIFILEERLDIARQSTSIQNYWNWMEISLKYVMQTFRKKKKFNYKGKDSKENSWN